jgi:hypothetical protein
METLFFLLEIENMVYSKLQRKKRHFTASHFPLCATEIKIAALNEGDSRKFLFIVFERIILKRKFFARLVQFVMRSAAGWILQLSRFIHTENY